MATTIAAAFEDQPTAKRAQESLAEHGIRRDKVAPLHGGKASLPDTDADSATYNETLRRGGALLMAQVEDLQFQTAVESLESNGAVDLEKNANRTGRHPGGRAAAAPVATPSSAAMDRAEDAIPVVEERVFMTEEIEIRKEAVERVETVRDTVRRTEGDAVRPAGRLSDA